MYTGCHRRNGPNFGRVFLMLNYTDITQNAYVQSWTVSEIMASEVWNFDSCYTYWLPNSYWNWQEYVVSVMLISVLNIKVTCELHKAINLNCKVPRTRVIVIHRVRSNIHHTGMLSGDVTRLVWLPACLPDIQGYAFQASVSRISMLHPRAYTNNANQLTAILRGPEGSPQFYLAIISITVQLGT